MIECETLIQDTTYIHTYILTTDQELPVIFQHNCLKGDLPGYPISSDCIHLSFKNLSEYSPME